ncbi:MAG: hypothetical protein AAF615_01020 [Pseudomonadota bacterium]
MSDEKKCKSLLEIVPETAVLAFDLVGWSEAHSPQRIAESKDVREAIDKELTKQAEALRKKHFSEKPVSQEDAVKFLSVVPKTILDKQSKEAQERLKCAYNESPIGVWLDENSWVLYVFVPLIVGAAGTYMYVAKTGDLPASWATSMAKTKKSFQTKKLGKITLGVSDISFVPSNRDLSVVAFGAMEWKRVALKFSMGGALTAGKPTTGLMGVDLTTAIHRNVDLTIGSQVVTNTGDWGGKSSVGLNFKGTGAASNMSLFLGSEFSYGQTEAFGGMPNMTVPMGHTVRFGLKRAF